MNRRSFIKSIAALLAAPVIASSASNSKLSYINAHAADNKAFNSVLMINGEIIGEIRNITLTDEIN